MGSFIVRNSTNSCECTLVVSQEQHVSAFIKDFEPKRFEFRGDILLDLSLTFHCPNLS